MTRPIGIDLGTTFSAAAVVRGGRPEILENRDGDLLTPSVVLYDGGEVLVGSMAKRTAAALPDDCVQFVKRHMGDPNWSFVDSDGNEHRAEQVSSAILLRVAEDAAMKLGEPVRDVVITVPAYFDDARRTATQHAGQIAGLRVHRLVNEPTAAAVAYGVTERRGGNLFVYDLGGGTFDVTVLRSTGTEFEVLATDGNRNLGGFDFDNLLMTHVAGQVQADGGPDLLAEPGLAADLRERCETAKRTLTTMSQAKLVLSGAGWTGRVTVTRAQLEELSADLLHTTEAVVEGVLADAGLGWDRIDHVLLVGGSTRMPMVRELVRRLSGKDPEVGFNPDEAVALGAAVIADQEGPGGAAEPVAIQDVTSQSLGTTALDELKTQMRNVILIPRNTRIPHKVEETFYTVVANQTVLRVDITEGDGEDPEYVAKLEERDFPLPPGLPEDAPIRHVMSYDRDGRVHLELFDETNHRALGEIELDRPLNLDRSEVDRLRVAMSKLEIR